MAYTPPTPKRLKEMRAESRMRKWSAIASFADNPKVSEWAEKKAAAARAEMKRLQEEKP
jgi:hypothetical protein